MTCHSVNNNIRIGLVISLCSNSNHLISSYPQTATNFRHLLSCGTIVIFYCQGICLFISVLYASFDFEFVYIIVVRYNVKRQTS